MRKILAIAATALAAAAMPAVAAAPSDDFRVDGGGADDNEQPYLQCVPYARDVSGIRIYGDAHTWWDQAANRYARGSTPREGAVMSFRPYGSMRLGHVAAVSKVIDSRTVLLRHANWSLIDGRRGQIEDNVRAIDVSDANDWSEVRVWFAPIQGLGTTRWPLNGFIYNDKPGTLAPKMTLAKADTNPRKSRIGADFLKGIGSEIPPVRINAATPAPIRTAALRAPAGDPIGAILARR